MRRFELYWHMGVRIGPIKLLTQSWNPFTATFVLNRKGTLAYGGRPYSHTGWWLRIGIFALSWRW